MQLEIDSLVNDIVCCFVDHEVIKALLDALGHAPESVIEVGAASGKLSIRLAMHGAKVLLVDHDPDMVNTETHLIEAARHILFATARDGGALQAWSALMDGRDLKGVETGSFELALNEGVLEHLPWLEQVQMLKEMARVSRDYVAFIVPSADHPENERIAAEVHHHYHGLAPTETPMTRADCEGIAEKAGLTVVRIQPVLERLLLVVCRKQVRKVS